MMRIELIMNLVDACHRIPTRSFPAEILLRAVNIVHSRDSGELVRFVRASYQARGSYQSGQTSDLYQIGSMNNFPWFCRGS